MLKKGIFIEECKNRFLCIVKINGVEELCYLPSSSKLSRFIELKEKEVLLTSNIGKNQRTKLTLHAVKTDEGPTLVNLNYINKLLYREFTKLGNPYDYEGKVLCEKKISNTLKVDFLIDGEQKIIVEAKGILSEHSIAKLPSMKVDRAVAQLKQFEVILKTGFKVHYYIVLMSRKIQGIEFDETYKEFYSIFKRCVRRGMNFFVLRTIWQGEEFSVERDIHIENMIRMRFLIKAKK